jgi:predicted nucleic acid-binding protein
VIVLDASVLIELLLRTDASESFADRILAPRESLHAPHLVDVEVAQVLRRYERAGSLSQGRCREALHDLADFPMTRYPHDVLLDRAWELRRNLTVYDAVYVALAEALDAPLLTRDQGIAALRGTSARVELV